MLRYHLGIKNDVSKFSFYMNKSSFKILLTVYEG